MHTFPGLIAYLRTWIKNKGTPDTCQALRESVRQKTNPLDKWPKSLCAVCCWINKEVFTDRCISLYFTRFFSHVIPLTISLLPSLLVCAGCRQSCVSDIAGKSGKTNWFLCAAVGLNSLTMGHLVCKAELEPSSAAETLQLELPLPICSVPPSFSLHVETRTAVFITLQLLLIRVCVCVCLSVDEWVKETKCMCGVFSQQEFLIS